MAAGISLGTIFASVQLSLATLQAQGAQAQAIFADVQASADEMAANVDAAMAGNVASTDAEAGSLTATGAAADASAAGMEANTAAVDANSASKDANVASTDASAASIDASTGASDASAASLDTNTAATDANSEAKDANAASTDAAAGAMKAALVPLLAMAAAVLALGVKTVNMAADFQSGMTLLVTGAGESASSINMLSSGILNMATQTGESTKELQAGLYQISSAGYTGAQGLTILRDAAEGAKVGNASLSTVTDATTTILKDFGNTGITSANAVNLLISTVSLGKTNMDDLAGAMSQILPTASAAGVGLNDVMGAMATMTGEGVPAAQAATYLRQTILALDAPSATAVKALASVGLTSADVASEMQKSLPDALAMITDAVGKKFPIGSAAYVAAIKDISGGTKTMQGMLDLTGSHLATFQSNVAAVASGVKAGGNSIVGWNAVQGDFNFKMDQARAAVEVFAIRMGTLLLPALTTIAGILLTVLVPVLTAVSNAMGFVSAHATILTPVIFALAGVVGGLLVAALVAAATAAWALLVPALIMAAPFIAVGAAIGLLIGIIVLLVTHWQQIADFLKTVWAETVATVESGLSALGAFFGSIFSAIGTTAHNFVTSLQAVLQAGFTFIQNLITSALQAIVAIFAWLYNSNYYFHDLVNDIIAVFHLLQADVTAIWQAIQATAAAIWQSIESVIIQPTQAAVSTVQSVIGSLVGTLQGIWNGIIASVQAAWQMFVSIISGQAGAAAGAANSVLQAIVGVLGNLAGMAVSWGRNLIQGFVNGIASMAGAAAAAAGNVVGGVAKVLGFHSPAQEGPGADADQWGPALGNMFAQGLLGTLSQVKAVALQLAQAANPQTALAALGITDTSASGAFAGSSANGSGVTIGTLNIPITIAASDVAGQTPEQVGTTIGRSVAQAFSVVLKQKGH